MKPRVILLALILISILLWAFFFNKNDSETVAVALPVVSKESSQEISKKIEKKIEKKFGEKFIKTEMGGKTLVTLTGEEEANVVDFSHALNQCVPSLAGEKISDIESLFNYIQSNVGAKSESEVFALYKIKMNTGEIRIFEIDMNDVEDLDDEINPDDNLADITYSRIDEKGFSIPIELQAARAFDEQKKQIDNIISDGEIIEQSIEKIYVLNDGSEIRINRKNLQLEKLQWRGNSKMLSCLGSECSCF